MAKQAKVVDLFNKDGSQSSYLLFSARLPEFMRAYPAEEGWKVEREAVSAASLQPELVQLHVAAVNAGKAPKDLGLPMLPSGTLFRARLVSPQGVTVRTASTLVIVRELTGLVPPEGGFKDWEAGETNAFQRLVAAMGFGGDQLDADERLPATTMASQDNGPSDPIPVVEVDDPEDGDTEEATSVGGAPSKAVAPVGARKASGAQLLQGLKRQVEMLARQQKVSVPEMNTVEDCKQALADLMPAKAS